jgi:nucleoside-diphosphate-sugar epimerase
MSSLAVEKIQIMILVSGGTGLVGSHLLVDLCKSGKQVRALKRNDNAVDSVKKVFSYYSENTEELFKNIEWVQADLLDVNSLEEAMEGVTQVYHCAAMVSFDSKKEAEMMLVNMEGTANMVNIALAKGVNKFCHVSSIATIGAEEHGKDATEGSFWKSSSENSNYSISKYGAEREVWRVAAEGLDVVIVNPALIIGAGNWQQSSSNMFSKAYKGIKFYTEGGTGFVDVRDVAKLMVKLMNSEHKNERFILNSENKSYKGFFDSMHQAFNKPTPSIKAGKLLSDFAWIVEKIRSSITGDTPLITKETARSAHKVSNYSNRKIQNIFPDYTFIPIEQSIKDTCRLFLKDLS